MCVPSTRVWIVPATFSLIPPKTILWLTWAPKTVDRPLSWLLSVDTPQGPPGHRVSLAVANRNPLYSLQVSSQWPLPDGLQHNNIFLPTSQTCYDYGNKVGRAPYICEFLSLLELLFMLCSIFPPQRQMPQLKRDQVLSSLWSQCLEGFLMHKRLSNYCLNEKTNTQANERILFFFLRYLSPVLLPQVAAL